MGTRGSENCFSHATQPVSGIGEPDSVFLKSQAWFFLPYTVPEVSCPKRNDEFHEKLALPMPLDTTYIHSKPPTMCIVSIYPLTNYCVLPSNFNFELCWYNTKKLSVRNLPRFAVWFFSIPFYCWNCHPFIYRRANGLMGHTPCQDNGTLSGHFEDEVLAERSLPLPNPKAPICHLLANTMSSFLMSFQINKGIGYHPPCFYWNGNRS